MTFKFIYINSIETKYLKHISWVQTSFSTSRKTEQLGGDTAFIDEKFKQEILVKKGEKPEMEGYFFE